MDELAVSIEILGLYRLPIQSSVLAVRSQAMVDRRAGSKGPLPDFPDRVCPMRVQPTGFPPLSGCMGQEEKPGIKVGRSAKLPHRSLSVDP